MDKTLNSGLGLLISLALIILGCRMITILPIENQRKIEAVQPLKMVVASLSLASPAILRIPINYENNARWSEAIEEVVLTIIKGDVPYYFLHLKSYLGVLQRRSL